MNCKELTFDTLTILVSLLDILSDIYITYLFWQHSHYTYFYISVSILVFTHLSYCILYVYLFKLSWRHVLLLLPISPFISFVLYCTATPQNNKLCKSLRQVLHIKNVNINHSNEIEERDPTKRWIEYTFRKHIGFICESLLESFGSFVLQLYVLLMSPTMAMDAVLSVSILFSLLSISMSLYFFCHSIYWKLFVFNYLCIIADIVKLYTSILLLNAMHMGSRSMFVYIWCVKLLFITSSSALYLSIQFIWNKIDGDLNSNWYQIRRTFGASGGRRRSISRSQSKSKSKSKSTNASGNTTHLSTYHISDSNKNNSQRRHRSKLWHFVAQSACVSSSQIFSELAFAMLFVAAVVLIWPFMILILEISSFSLIAFVIDRFNTSRFVSIHWNLWQFIFAFLLRTKKTNSYHTKHPQHTQHRAHPVMNRDQSSRSQTLTIATSCTTNHTLSPTDSANECVEHEDMSYAETFNESELSQVSQISQQHNNYLDATELEVRLNTLANSGGCKRNPRVKKQAKLSKTNAHRYLHPQTHIDRKHIPWNEQRDIIIRLSTINYILAQHREARKLYKYLDAALQDNLFVEVELDELRFYSSQAQGMTASAYDAIFGYHHRNIVEKWYALTKHKNANYTQPKTILFKKSELLCKWVLVFVVLPMYFVSQLLLIVSPYMLYVHVYDSLLYYAHTSIVIYTLFVVALCVMFASIYRFSKITSHIHHNCILYFSSYNSSFNDIERKIIEDINHLYQNLVATQTRRDCLANAFGDDICALIQSYLPRFHVVLNENDNENDNDEHEEAIFDLNHHNLQICVTPAKSQCSNNETNNKNKTNNASDNSGCDTDHSN
eukprot:237272_1